MKMTKAKCGASNPASKKPQMAMGGYMKIEKAKKLGAYGGGYMKKNKKKSVTKKRHEKEPSEKGFELPKNVFLQLFP